MPPKRQARDALILANAAWARTVALHAVRRWRLRIDPEEAVAVANLKLVETAARYRRGRGAGFQTYAGRRLIGAILDHCRAVNGRWVSKGKPRHRPDPIPLADVAPEIEDQRAGPYEGAVRRWLFDRIAELPDPEAYVLREIYFADRSQNEIAIEMGFHESRVCQLAKAGITHLRESCDRPRRR